MFSLCSNFRSGHFYKTGVLVVSSLLFLCNTTNAVPSLFLEFAYGFTSYNPADLNKVNGIFEQAYTDAGAANFNTYRFDGNFITSASIGMPVYNWKMSLNADVWKERFLQTDIPFSILNVAGMTTVDNKYLFIPVVISLQRTFKFKKLIFHAGYGIGTLLGNASAKITTHFNGSATPENLTFDLTSPPLLLHRFIFDLIYDLHNNFGISLSTGYRIAKIKHFQVSNTKGSSYILNILFNDGVQNNDKLYLAYDRVRFANQNEVQTTYKIVQGNMNGYFVMLKLLYYIGAVNEL